MSQDITRTTTHNPIAITTTLLNTSLRRRAAFRVFVKTLPQFDGCEVVGGLANMRKKEKSIP